MRACEERGDRERRELAVGGEIGAVVARSAEMHELAVGGERGAVVARSAEMHELAVGGEIGAVVARSAEMQERLRGPAATASRSARVGRKEGRKERMNE